MQQFLCTQGTGVLLIGEVAQAAGVSARSLSRGFRRHRATTIKGFIKERRLEEANRKLTLKNEEIYEVTHAITHDLRKPLVSVKAMIGVLKELVQPFRW